ncbi:methyltransferase [Microbacterium sp. MYb62]|uniref:class I SAM-dependent methyltransferase n=1 Tax=Microbacterium sp. MYb62 TaxID=1848690 RepID=UPI0021571E41|nr:methyltransferase [Microbacterium sp. MYb62]
MPEFPYSRLRRWPDVEADNLQAYDATDLLLVERALSFDIPGSETVVIGDEYGAITVALGDAGRRGIRVHQDLATGRRALQRNAEELGFADAAGRNGDEDDAARHAGGGPEAPGFRPLFTPHELDATLLTGARLVLLQLPKSLAELEEIVDAIARWAAPDVVLVAGGRVKHMTLRQNEVLGRSFAHVQAQRAERKSRLIVASEPLPVPADPPFPVTARHDGLTLVAHGGAFAGARLDIGTRALLEVLGAQPTSSAVDVLDLGCGTGALAVSYALAHPEARVTATDRSAAAVASARATAAANGVADRVTVTQDDAASEVPDASIDLVLLNPPFHLGASIHTGAATRLFAAAARVLRPGGELFTVYNSSLGYRAELTRLIGPTAQLQRTPKFTVTRSIRSSETPDS